MRVKVIFIVAIFASTSYLSVAFPAEHNKPQNSSADIHEIKHYTPTHQPSHFKPEELINQQPENVRHIIATEQRNRQDGLRQVKKEKAIVSIDDENFPTLEELRAKCQHFSRLFGLGQTGSGFVENYANGDTMERHSSTIPPLRAEYYNRPIIEVTRRPVYIRNKPTFIQKNHGGFYVTASTTGNEVTTTRKPLWGSTTTYSRVAYTSSEHSTKQTSTTPIPSTTTTRSTPFVSTAKIENVTEPSPTFVRPNIRIKYTKFEPVILQKTILTDGRVIYHWHRSLPSAAVDLPAPTAPLATPLLQPATYEYPPVPIVMSESQRNAGLPEPSTTESPTSSTTTTEKSSWLFVPFSNLFGGSHEEETTVESDTAAPIPTTSTGSTIDRNKLKLDSTTDLNPSYSSTEEPKLTQQLKLIVPINYDEVDSTLATQNNLLGYYRKPVGATNGVPSPSLHVIKTIGVPQSIPRYRLGYTGTAYGLTFNNGIPYTASYGPDYMNYLPYNNVPIEREDKKLDDVSL